MRVLPLIALVGATMFPLQAAADELDLQINSIFRAYSAACQPTFYQDHKIGDGQWDAQLYADYGRTLLVRHLGNCQGFYNADVTRAAAAIELRKRVPELQRSGRSTLTQDQRVLAGMMLHVDDLSRQCNTAVGPEIEALRPVAAEYQGQMTEADGLHIADGYVSIDQFVRVLYGLAVGSTVDLPCAAMKEAEFTLVSQAAGMGLADLEQAYGGGPEGNERGRFQQVAR